MKYYAEIQDGIVVNTSCAEDDWVAPNHFVEYTFDRAALIGCAYNEELNRFVYEQPFPSWTLDSNLDWQPPVAKPEGDYVWNEEVLAWVVPFAG